MDPDASDPSLQYYSLLEAWFQNEAMKYNCAYTGEPCAKIGFAY